MKTETMRQHRSILCLMRTYSWFAGAMAAALLIGCEQDSGNSGGLGAISTSGRPTTGFTYHNADLGEGSPASVSVYKLPDIEINGRLIAPLMYTSSMAIDADGMGDDGVGGEALDPLYGQNDTSLHYAGSGKPLDARYVRYFVLPEGFNGQGNHPPVYLGDVAAVLYNGKLAYAIFGDAGAVQHGLGSQLGEGSMALAEDLGIPNDPANGGVANGVTYIIFPGSGPNPTDVLSSDQMNSIGHDLFVAAGGSAD